MAITDDINCACSDDRTGQRTLAELREELMVRLGFGAQLASPPPGMTDLLNSLLQGAQRSLYRRYDVLRTLRYFSWSLVAGARLYDVPDNDEQAAGASQCTKRLDPRKVTWVGVERDGVYYELKQGIPPELESYSQTGWPERYEFRQCIEVWPAPADSNGHLIVKGRFELEAFTADSDKPTIDDELVFLLALANAKAHYRQPDANNYVAQMETLLADLVAGSHQTARYLPGQRKEWIFVPPAPTVPFP